MERLIIYGSQYGTTKRYAQKFSEMTGIPSLSYEAANDLTDCRRFRFPGWWPAWLPDWYGTWVF